MVKLHCNIQCWASNVRHTNSNKRLQGKFSELPKADDDLRHQSTCILGRKAMFLEPYTILPMSIKLGTVDSFSSDIFFHCDILHR